MKKAFCISPTGCELIGGGNATATRKAVVDFTVVVQTRECLGQGVLVAGKVITSLFLVRNDIKVKILVSRMGHMPALVSRRDYTNNLAELMPISFEKKGLGSQMHSGVVDRHVGPIGAINDPMLVSKISSGKQIVEVATMRYLIESCERREADVWKIMPNLPVGRVGGGVWNIGGDFVGLTLATKKPYRNLESETLLTLPAEAVMNFAETN